MSIRLAFTQGVRRRRPASALLLLAGLPVGARSPSYLYQPAYSLKACPCPAVAYTPQPGDVLLATDKNLFWKVTHDLALAFEPHNSAVVFAARRRLAGHPRSRTQRHALVPLSRPVAAPQGVSRQGPRLDPQSKTPLTPEQCCKLTEFASAQEGKHRFALMHWGCS